MKILVVEDNEMNRDMLRRRLERRGFQVLIAVDGREALAVAPAEMPDVILMDLSLPLKAHPAASRIPVIALTAHAMPADRQKAYDAGCDEFETKPVDLERLLSKITAVLSKTGNQASR
jgi:two-component system cell cycle response regulator DivK